jgi:hypothetical protein
MPKFTTILGQFPDFELDIRRLAARDPDFAAICEDYDEAARALRNWEAAGPNYEARAGEYRDMVGELEGEIFRALEDCGTPFAKRR